MASDVMAGGVCGFTSDYSNLSRRPQHLPLAEEVHVEMRNAFAGIGAVVDDEAEALHQAEFLGDDAADDNKMADQRFVGSGGIADPRNLLFRDNQQMDRRLRLDVVNDDAAVVLMLDARGDFAVDDALEDRFYKL
jgi:hypothetical protein